MNIRGILRYTGKFQCSSAVPNIKYDCALLFCVCIFVLFLVTCGCFRIYFLIDHHCKTPQIRQKLLKFLRGVMVSILTHNFCELLISLNFWTNNVIKFPRVTKLTELTF